MTTELENLEQELYQMEYNLKLYIQSIETQTWLIQQLKKSGIKLNFLKRQDYNGELKRPKIEGNETMRETAKFILLKINISFLDWIQIK